MYRLKQTARKLVTRLKQIPHRVGLTIAFVLLFLLTIVTAFMIEKPAEFSYNGDTCVRHLTLLPDYTAVVDPAMFEVTYAEVVKIGDFKLMSLKTCFVAVSAPLTGNNKVEVALLSDWFAKKTFVVKVPEPPTAFIEVLSRPIPSAKPLTIGLSHPDSIFQYQLTVGGIPTMCAVQESVLECDIESLGLRQGQQYGLELTRLFEGDKVSVMLEKEITTLVATSVIGASVSPGQILYDKPRTFTVSFDKNVTSADVTLRQIGSEGTVIIPLDVEYITEGVLLTIANDLERSATYEVSVSNVEAVDGSTLVDPYRLEFQTSGGPSVRSTNVSATGSSLTYTIIITFDQPLLDSQDITKLVSVEGVTAKLSKKNNQVFISYTAAPKCSELTVSLGAGLLSSYGVVQPGPWSLKTRTICYDLTTIGQSRAGRSIFAYTFGSGPSTILHTGAIHGNELSSKLLMESWIKELDKNFSMIPTSKKVVVVPVINPDGVAANTRNNSSNVDLNRNFDTEDWQTDIVSPTNQPIAGGGGSSPMSEPETQAIAALTTQLKPRLTMSFHSAASYVIANQAGDSGALATTYADRTGYKNMTGVSGAFGYAITGTYDDWIAQRLGLPSILVELKTNTDPEFSRNVKALWTMLQI